jgi:fused signal recognition particle receptor
VEQVAAPRILAREKMTKPKNFLTGLFGKKHATGHEGDAQGAPEAASGDLPPTDLTPVERAAAHEEKPVKQGFFARLTDGLTRSSQRLSDGVAAIVTKRKLDHETLDELEELLIGADLGVAAAGRVRETLARDRFNKEISDEEVRTALADVVTSALAAHQKPLVIDPARRPHVILTVGVNGAGKTTTIGKLAEKFRRDGLNVMLAAGDTFRAAAVEQLKIWGERAGASVIAKETGADAAGLAYEALERARREGVDVLLIDTAGRLQNRRELMDELAKIVRVLKKLDADAPHDTLLVLDATVGQNAISQADAFRDIAGVTGLVMTKLDGTARGGVLVALADRHPLPIHFIGVGEGVEDLQVFEAAGFSRALAGLSSLGGRR